MGFEFSETMAGTVEWTAEPGKRQPFRFDVTVHADSTRDHFATGKAELRGTVYAPPKSRAAPAQGVITIRPFGPGDKRIRYELAFTADDGSTLEFVGQKDISYLRLFETFTTLPGELKDGAGRTVGTALTHFDPRHLWKFLRSFRRA